MQETKRVSELESGVATLVATPPLEAPRFLFYLMTTLVRPAGEEWVIVFIDVSKIHTHCENVRRIVIELPAEAEFSKDHVGLLVKDLDEQRDASQLGEMKVLEVLSEVGFAPGLFSPSFYWLQKRKARTGMHGDDIVTLMSRSGVTSFIGGVGEHFMNKVTVFLGPQQPSRGGKDNAHARIMNVLISRERGFTGDCDWSTWEADHRQVELLGDQGGLATGSKTGVSQSWSSPSARSSKSVCMRASFLAAEVLKQRSDNNVADLGTKRLDGKRIQQLETLAGLSSRTGVTP